MSNKSTREGLGNVDAQGVGRLNECAVNTGGGVRELRLFAAVRPQEILVAW